MMTVQITDLSLLIRINEHYIVLEIARKRINRSVSSKPRSLLLGLRLCDCVDFFLVGSDCKTEKSTDWSKRSKCRQIICCEKIHEHTHTQTECEKVRR